MMKKTILLLLLVVAILTQAQSQHKKMRQFEQTLASFRYSLYPELAALDKKTLYSWFGNHPQTMPKNLSQKLEAFYQKHAKTIQQYRVYQLNQHASNASVDLSKYQEVEFRNEQGIRLSPSKLSAWNHIFTVNPLRHIEMMSTKALAHQLAATEFGSQSLYDNLAQPRLIVHKQANQHWEVWVDKYFWVLKFDYQPEKVELKLTGLFKRK